MGISQWNLVGLLKSHSDKVKSKNLKCGSTNCESVNGKLLLIIRGVTNVSFFVITVHLKIPGTTVIMAIVRIYHPQRSENNSNDSTVITEFGLYLKTFISQFKRCIIVGDINIHFYTLNDNIPYNYLKIL